MTARKPLRAVTADETVPQSVRPKTVTEAAAFGTTRELLVATRSRLAEDVQNKNTPSRDLAALTKRLFEVVRDIEGIDARAEQEAERADEATDEAFDASAV